MPSSISHPEHFQLLCGTPLRDYAAPVEGPTTQASRRMSVIFEREMFEEFTSAQRAAVDTPALSPALLLIAWGDLHGLVALEVFSRSNYSLE
ncbi:TetR-like C-terminal domain-containing protein [Streptomyces sp. P9-A4]|uniref:TetR-like C-terminal domain-containing protein n=1 Tax=Streptomyces sp. P9-A4 TaxID=3072285 RepID=UPI003FCDE3B0